jgi:hypothetical protein
VLSKELEERILSAQGSKEKNDIQYNGSCILCSLHTFATACGNFWPSALRRSALHAIRNIDIEESNQDVSGDGEDDIQSSQSLEVVVGVALQPVHWYGDDAVDYEQRSDQEMFLSWLKGQLRIRSVLI